MPAHKRRGRNDGLYQAYLHRRIDRSIVYEEIQRERTIDEVYARALEAKRHKARLTFIPPIMLIRLIETHDEHERLKARVEGKREP